jgi:hypothetical protein
MDVLQEFILLSGEFLSIFFSKFIYELQCVLL